MKYCPGFYDQHGNLSLLIMGYDFDSSSGLFNFKFVITSCISKMQCLKDKSGREQVEEYCLNASYINAM